MACTANIVVRATPAFSVLAPAPAAAKRLASSSAAAPAPKLAFLCLHGHAQDGEKLRKRTGALRKTLKSLAEFDFVDSPLVLTESEPEKRSWYRFGGFENGNRHFDGVEEALDAVQAAMGRRQYHGVLSFSQGSSVAAFLLAAGRLIRAGLVEPLEPEARALVERVPGAALLKHGVIVSGFVPGDVRMRAVCAAAAEVGGVSDARVAVVYGEADNDVDPRDTEALFTGGLDASCTCRTEVKARMGRLAKPLFVSPHIVRHPGGHLVPSDASSRGALKGWLGDNR